MKADSTPISKAAPANPAGLIGLSVEEARKSHFFQWFHLEPSDEKPPHAHSFVFRPSGAKFHDLIMVTAHTDAAHRINAIALVIARSFIDHPSEGMFAADIGKSFLEVALSPADREAMQPLIDTIATGGHYDRPVIMLKDQEPHPHHIQRDSPPYLTWLGHSPHWKHAFALVSLEFDNARIAGTKDLEIVVRVH